MKNKTFKFNKFYRILLVIALTLPVSARIPICAGDGPEQDKDASASYMIEVSSIADLAPLFESAGNRRFVLLGESTHGTHEYYHWRDQISRKLIRDHNFRFVAIEGDWESIFQLNKYVKHRTPDDVELRTLMTRLDRWPQWMWANEEFKALLEWMRETNAERPEAERIGVYGLDMQNPEASLEAVVQWFEQNEPDTVATVREHFRPVYGIPDGFRAYAQSLARGGQSARDNFVQVADMLKERRQDNQECPDLFSAKMNALALVSAEGQHAAMISRGPESWNVRARFMEDAFKRLAQWYGDDSRGIVWAHNTHVGDATATDMLNRGQVNIGQLLREEFGSDQVFILGFSTARGNVLAGRSWGSAMQNMTIIPPRDGSLEAMLKEYNLDQALLIFDAVDNMEKWKSPVLHRAIGVVYNPPNEAYVMTVPAKRYDAIFFIRETRELTPL